MADGGYDQDDTEFLLKDYEPNDDYHDDAVQQSLNTTQPFKPGQASTPYHGGEQVEMQTMQHEQTGLLSYFETSFGGEPMPSTDEISMRLSRLSASLRDLKINKITGPLDISQIPDERENPFSEIDKKRLIDNAIRFTKYHFPQAQTEKLNIRFSYKNPLELVIEGPRKGETPIFLKDGSDFQQSFLNAKLVKNYLGPRAD